MDRLLDVVEIFILGIIGMALLIFWLWETFQSWFTGVCL